MGPKGDRWWNNWVDKDPVLEHRRQSRAICGEKRLMLAVFKDGIKKKDISWVKSRDQTPFSFDHLCEALDVDSDSARSTLIKRFRKRA